MTYTPVRTGEEMSRKKWSVKNLLKRRIPIIEWLPFYTWNKLLQDCLAGLTVGLTAIPQGIAYAIVAGLPAQYGLYSGFMALLVYVVLGGSKDITIGPTAILALMAREYTSKIGEDGAVLLCFLMGCFILILGILHLGFLVDFISMPVTFGFTNAAAITIAATQLKSLFGLTGSGNGFVQSFIVVFDNLSNINIWDTLLGIITILTLVGLKYIGGNRNGNFWEKFKWVTSLARNAVVVIFGTLLAYLLFIYNIEPFQLTGNIEEGLPPFGLPPFTITHNNQTYNFIECIHEFGIGVVSVPLIAVLENIAIAKAFAKGKSLDATQEMIALGIGNIFGSFVRSMPTTGSFTRTAINNASGVQTQMGGVFTAILVLLACGLLTFTFQFIPKTSLAAVIIVAMYYMLDFQIFKILWRSRKTDLLPLTVTLITCIFWSLEYGMIVGILVDMVLILYTTARPGVIVKSEIIDEIQVLVLTPRQSLSYPAAEYLREEVISRCEAAGEILPVILDGRHVHRIDATVAKNLKYLQDDLKSRKQIFVLWNWSSEVKEILEGYDNSIAKHFLTELTSDAILTQATEREITIQTE